MKIASEHQDTIACSSLSALDKDTTLRVRLEAKVKFPFSMCTAQLIDLRCRLFADQSASVYVSSNQKVSAPCRAFLSQILKSDPNIATGLEVSNELPDSLKS